MGDNGAGSSTATYSTMTEFYWHDMFYWLTQCLTCRGCSTRALLQNHFPVVAWFSLRPFTRPVEQKLECCLVTTCFHRSSIYNRVISECNFIKLSPQTYVHCSGWNNCFWRENGSQSIFLLNNVLCWVSVWIYVTELTFTDNFIRNVHKMCFFSCFYNLCVSGSGLKSLVHLFSAVYIWKYKIFHF